MQPRGYEDLRGGKTTTATAGVETPWRWLQIVSRTGTLFAASEDWHGTLAAVARLVLPGVADGCLVDLIDESGRARRLQTAHVVPEKEQRLREGLWASASSGDPIATSLRSGLPLIHDRVTAELLERLVPEPALRKAVAELPLRSVLVAPLVARARTLGAITLLVTESDRSYSPADLAFALDFARQAALAIDGARLLATERRMRAAVEEEAELRRRAEQSVRSAREALAELVRASPAAMFELDARGRVVEWNPAAERIFGWRRDEVLGKPNPIVDPSSEEEFMRSFRRELSGEALPERRIRRTRKDGAQLDLRLSATLVRGEGGVVTGVLGMFVEDHPGLR